MELEEWGAGRQAERGKVVCRDARAELACQLVRADAASKAACVLSWMEDGGCMVQSRPALTSWPSKLFGCTCTKTSCQQAGLG